MSFISESVLVRFDPNQNASLEQSFREFYKLDHSPRLEKDLYVDKKSYQKYLNRRLRERTPYEADNTSLRVDFDPHKRPFSVLYTACKATFPSGRVVTLTEYLDGPDGATKGVVLEDSTGEQKTFDKYFEAEIELLNRYLGDKQIGNAN